MNGTQWIFDVVNRGLAPIKEMMEAIDVTTAHTKLFDDSLKQVSENEAGIHGVGVAFGEVGNEIIGAAAGFGLWTSAEAILEGVTEGIKETYHEVEEAQKRYDRFSLVLSNNEGAQKAGESMEMLEKVAKDAAQPIIELRDAYTSLEFKGISVGGQQLEGLADLAIDAGKDIGQLMNAIEMASLGSTRALRQFGIRMEAIKGDTEHVTATFRGHKEIIDSSADSVLKYVIRLGQIPGAAGTAAQFTQMYAGKTIELANRWDKFYEDMGKNFNKSLIDFTNFKIHAIDKLQESIEWVIKHKDDFVGVFQDITTAIIATTGAWVALNAVELAGQALAGIGLLAIEGLTAAQWLYNYAVEANPIGTMLALAASAYVLWRRVFADTEGLQAVKIELLSLYEAGKEVFKGLVDLLQPFGTAIKGIGEQIIGAFTFNPAMFTKGLNDMMLSVRQAGETPMKFHAMMDNVHGAKQKVIDHYLAIGGDGDKDGVKSLFGESDSKNLFNDKKADASTGGSAGSVTGGGGRSVIVHTINIAPGMVIHTSDMSKTAKEHGKQYAAEMITAIRDFEAGISNG